MNNTKLSDLPKNKLICAREDFTRSMDYSKVGDNLTALPYLQLSVGQLLEFISENSGHGR